MEPIVVGLSAFHHDSAACILRGAELVGAVQEERFTRTKHQGGIPFHAFRWCLEAAGLAVQDIDAVAVGIDPVALAQRRAAFPTPTNSSSEDITEARLRAKLGIEAPIHFVPHHRAHAASAFHFSGFADAAVLVADGVGDWPCTTVWHGSDRSLDLVRAWDFPHSLGLFYATITSWLGFRVNRDEYKVMGLAALGEPSVVDKLELVLRTDPATTYALDLDYFDFLGTQPMAERSGAPSATFPLIAGSADQAARVEPSPVGHATRMYSDRLIELLGPARRPGGELTDHHRNVAASAQRVLESRLLSLAELARQATNSPRLCVAGGVGLNAVANARIVADGPFDEVFFQPAAGDSGTALGAASAVMVELGGPMPSPLVDARCGPSFDTNVARSVAAGAGVACADYAGDEAGLIAHITDVVASGGIVGWFHGPMEFGPRALGARCLIADPRSAGTRDRINMFIKDREPWRPLAPMVPADRVSDFFETNRPLRFMVETVEVVPDAGLDAVTHVDGTARPQTIPASMTRLIRLLKAVERRIGMPVLVSTSFNHASEPIVCSPTDALLAASRLGLDALVLEDLVITELQPSSYDLVAAWQATTSQSVGEPNLYPL